MVAAPGALRRLLATVPAMLVLAGRGGAQGAVSGQITILEREGAGARTADLASAVVWLEPLAGARAAAPENAQIAMESRQYVPHVRVVTVGSTVEFPNQDPFRHNVFSKSGPGEFDLGLYQRGETRGATLRRPGVYPVFCNIHARMLAFVVAVATPHHAQAGSDGRFALPDVPAGRYRLRVWHERGGEQATEVDVPAEGAGSLRVELDARGFKRVQHKNKFGQDYGPAGRDRY
jgi:plastocyanin